MGGAGARGRGGTRAVAPWRPDELDRVLAAVEELHTAFTPSPVDAGSAGAVLEEKVNGACSLPTLQPSSIVVAAASRRAGRARRRRCRRRRGRHAALISISDNIPRRRARFSSTGRMRRSARLGSTSSRSLPASPCRVVRSRGPAAEVVGRARRIRTPLGRRGVGRLLHVSRAAAAAAGPPDAALVPGRAGRGREALARAAHGLGVALDHPALGRPASARGGSTAAACAARSTRASRPSSPRDAGSQRSPCSDSRARGAALSLRAVSSSSSASRTGSSELKASSTNPRAAARRPRRLPQRVRSPRSGRRSRSSSSRSPRARAHDRDHVLGRVRHGQREKRTRPLGRDACDHRLAAVREMDVEQHDVRVGLDDQRDRLGCCRPRRRRRQPRRARRHRSGTGRGRRRSRRAS